MEIRLEVPGRPVAWERVRTNRGRFFKPRRTRNYEEAVAWTCRAQNADMGGAPCIIAIEFRAKRKLTGDIDNYAKAVLDGLQIGGMIQNDKQVCELHLSFGPNTEDMTHIILRDA
jgi:Holliday junction resolvase RusA-like endonuclease